MAVFSTESVLEGLKKHREKEEKGAEDVGRDEEGECAGYEDRGEEIVSGWFEPRQDERRVLARKEMLILAVCRASVEVLRGVPTVCALPFFVPYHERWVMQTGSPGREDGERVEACHNEDYTLQQSWYLNKSRVCTSHCTLLWPGVGDEGGGEKERRVQAMCCLHQWNSLQALLPDSFMRYELSSSHMSHRQ